jgi:hypothetical protein
MSDVSEIYRVIWSLNSMGDMNVCSCPKPTSCDIEPRDEVFCVRDLCDECELECNAELVIFPDLEMFLCSISPELERVTLALIGHAMDREYLEEQ